MRTAAIIRHSAGLGLLLAVASIVNVGAQTSAPDAARPILTPNAPAAPTRPMPALAPAPIGTANVAESPALDAMRLLSPRIQSLTITPSGDANSARLTLQLSEPDRSPKEFTLQNGERRAVLGQTQGDQFTGDVEFDLEAFIREQEARAELSKRGALVPTFSGRHFVGLERVQFMDPNALRNSARLRQAFAIPFGVLNGIPVTVDPGRELMITDLSVVEDPTRTFDVCTGKGAKMGAWTFGKLLTDMANGQIDPAKMVEAWLQFWLKDQTVNSFNVPQRAAGMQNLLLNSWKRTPGGLLDLAEAPMRLLAIVNRIDLRGNSVYGGDAGEARFVFGVLDPKNCQSIPPFTVILEYGVPVAGCSAIHTWAQQWHNLGSIVLGTAAFNTGLQKITDQFAGPGVAPKKPNGSALNQLRTNEIALSSPWELREFHLDAASHGFNEVTVVQTPDLSFFHTSTLKSYIDANQAAIIAGTNKVPLSFQNAPFLGGNAPNNFMFWASSPPENSNDARHFFSLNTCNGCHGRETNTGFTHVDTRAAGSPSGLSQFLIGNGTLASPATHQVPDPILGGAKLWTDGDLLRRQQDLATLLGSSCRGGGLLSGLKFLPLNAPH
jgi:hypothetical protein